MNRIKRLLRMEILAENDPAAWQKIVGVCAGLLIVLIFFRCLI